MLKHEDRHLENVRERMKRNDPSEMSPEPYVERLRSRMRSLHDGGRSEGLARVTEEIANMRILCLLSLRSKPHS
jgi:hypothetical protein